MLKAFFRPVLAEIAVANAGRSPMPDGDNDADRYVDAPISDDLPVLVENKNGRKIVN